jgi:hypothetical protein
MKGVSPETFVADHLVDQTDDSILSDEAKRKEVVDDFAYKPPKKSAKKKGEDDDDEDDDAPSNAVGRRLHEMKAVMSNLPETNDDEEEEEEEEDNDEADERPAKKSKTDDVEAYAKAMRLYFKMKNDDLKSVLRWNLGYGTTGNKDILLLR